MKWIAHLSTVVAKRLKKSSKLVVHTKYVVCSVRMLWSTHSFPLMWKTEEAGSGGSTASGLPRWKSISASKLSAVPGRTPPKAERLLQLMAVVALICDIARLTHLLAADLNEPNTGLASSPSFPVPPSRYLA